MTLHHVTDDDTATSYYEEAEALLRAGEPLPVDLRMRLNNCGYNVAALERKYGL